MTPALLATKHARPRPAATALARPRLEAMLADDRRLTLISAPAGYGKTTLVARWLAAVPRPTAWVTLDADDNDPAVFLGYLVAAVGDACPGAWARPEAVPAWGSDRSALVALLNAVAAAHHEPVLVLDDYHAITDAAVHDLVGFLVAHAPAGMRLVILTRADPPLPLARLRARGELTEIRAGELRFHRDEAGAMLATETGRTLDDPTVELVWGRTEGWAAGLQLAALSLRASEPGDGFLAAMRAADRFVFDYLTDEALARQPEQVRRFIESTCVLHRLTGPLCDKLTATGGGDAMLAALARSGLFVTPLDDRGEWYRYHGLFAELVGSGLPADRRRLLDRTAAEWFEAAGLAADAIRHRLAAGDVAEAADLVQGAADAALGRGEFRSVIGWCRSLPADVVAARPTLLTALACAQFFDGDLAAAERTLDRDGRETGNSPAGRRACLRAWFANRRDEPEAERLARAAVASIREDDPVFLSLAWTTLGEATAGRDAAVAHDAFTRAEALARTSGRSALAAGAVYSLAMTELVAGRRNAAEERCRGAIAMLADPGGLSPAWIGMAHVPLGVALFEAALLEPARAHLSLGRELLARAGFGVTMLGAGDWTEILVLHELGYAAEAWRRTEQVRREAERRRLPRIAAGMRLLAAELLLREGDAEGAHDVVTREAKSVHGSLGIVRDRSMETTARVALARGRADEALVQLGRLEADERAGGRDGRLARTLVLQALAEDRLGRADAAARRFEAAIRIAAGESLRRPFLDPVFPVGPLLARARSAAPAFVRDLVERAGVAGHGSPPVERGDGVPPEPLVEPLSMRELEVLRLVAAGLSNEEIGRALFVTPGTAKWHVHNVLGKLGCRNRVQLVARARSLGLA